MVSERCAIERTALRPGQSGDTSLKFQGGARLLCLRNHEQACRQPEALRSAPLTTLQPVGRASLGNRQRLAGPSSGHLNEPIHRPPRAGLLHRTPHSGRNPSYDKLVPEPFRTHFASCEESLTARSSEFCGAGIRWIPVAKTIRIAFLDRPRGLSRSCTRRVPESPGMPCVDGTHRPSALISYAFKISADAQFTKRRTRMLLTNPIAIHVKTMEEPP